MSKHSRAFTLVELLVVLAVVAILAGLLFPVLTKAKASAKVETSKQYLRQQYITVELYAQDHEGLLPNWETVQGTPRMHAPCSPLDAWRTPCWQRRSPMLGSFGYVVPLADDLDDPVTHDGGSRPILADAFSSDYRLGEFSGPRFESYTACSLAGTCELPKRIWFVYTDGSLRLMRNPSISLASRYNGKARTLFSWPTLFHLRMALDAKSGNAAQSDAR